MGPGNCDEMSHANRLTCCVQITISQLLPISADERLAERIRISLTVEQRNRRFPNVCENAPNGARIVQSFDRSRRRHGIGALKIEPLGRGLSRLRKRARRAERVAVEYVAFPFWQGNAHRVLLAVQFRMSHHVHRGAEITLPRVFFGGETPFLNG